MTIEEELAEIVRVNDLDMPLYRTRDIAQAILSSGLVIPVSALDGMKDKIAEVMWLSTQPESTNLTWEEMKEFASNTTVYELMREESLTNAQRLINAIKQEAGK